MKEIYELSAYETKAADFFKTLLEHETDLVLDVRLKNVSQLCGFTKKRDLEYLISQITQARYIHDLNFAPTQELLDGYIITHQIDWKEYASTYQALIEERNGITRFITTYSSYKNICILGTATHKRKSHSAVLVSLLQEACLND